MKIWRTLIVIGLCSSSACMLRPPAVPTPASSATPATPPPTARTSDELIVRDVRLEPVVLPDGGRASRLTFELENASSRPAVDVVLRISFVPDSSDSTRDAATTTVAGPLTIQGTSVLNAGYAMQYDMTLRNVASDEGCHAAVDVLSARWLDETQQTALPRNH